MVTYRAHTRSYGFSETQLVHLAISPAGAAIPCPPWRSGDSVAIVRGPAHASEPPLVVRRVGDVLWLASADGSGPCAVEVDTWLWATSRVICVRVPLERDARSGAGAMAMERWFVDCDSGFVRRATQRYGRLEILQAAARAERVVADWLGGLEPADAQRLDGSLKSLGILERMLLGAPPSPHGETVGAGPEWYVGEVVRQSFGGVWCVAGDAIDEPSFGIPGVRLPAGRLLVPRSILERIASGDGDALQAAIEQLGPPTSAPTPSTATARALAEAVPQLSSVAAHRVASLHESMRLLEALELAWAEMHSRSDRLRLAADFVAATSSTVARTDGRRPPDFDTEPGWVDVEQIEPDGDGQWRVVGTVHGGRPLVGQIVTVRSSQSGAARVRSATYLPVTRRRWFPGWGRTRHRVELTLELEAPGIAAGAVVVERPEVPSHSLLAVGYILETFARAGVALDAQALVERIVACESPYRVAALEHGLDLLARDFDLSQIPWLIREAPIDLEAFRIELAKATASRSA